MSLDASESLGGIPVQLNLGVSGDLFASGSAVSWRLFSGDFAFDYLTQIGSDPRHSAVGIDFISGGESLNGDVHVVSGFTVNDADLFLVDNRFSPAPADAAVPEPSTLLRLGTGLLASRRFRRGAKPFRLLQRFGTAARP